MVPNETWDIQPILADFSGRHKSVCLPSVNEAAPANNSKNNQHRHSETLILDHFSLSASRSRIRWSKSAV